MQMFGDMDDETRCRALNSMGGASLGLRQRGGAPGSSDAAAAPRAGVASLDPLPKPGADEEADRGSRCRCGPKTQVFCLLSTVTGMIIFLTWLIGWLLRADFVAQNLE